MNDENINPQEGDDVIQGEGEVRLGRPRSLYITRNFNLKATLEKTLEGRRIIAIFEKTKNISKKRDKLTHLCMTAVLGECNR